jgi:hypothetical protein
MTFQEHISKAIEFIQKAPMPGDMGQFRAVALAIKQLTKAVTPKEEI